MEDKVTVTWETVCDGKTREGGNLPDGLRALIEAGFTLDVMTPQGVKTFTDADVFVSWFDQL